MGAKKQRVSHSLLDPLFIPHVKPLYRLLPIPRGFPPEGIVLIGHLFAILGALGLAWCLENRLWALMAALGPAMSHLCDMVDGTHARETGQCRNSGELLDHLVDPIAFSYWIIGLAVSVHRLDLALIGVVIIFAIALLTNLKAKIVGEFTIQAFGSTEVRVILVLYGLAQFLFQLTLLAHILLGFLLLAGGVMFLLQLIHDVRAVNLIGPPPDDSEWVLAGQEPEKSPAASFSPEIDPNDKTWEKLSEEED